jgi:Uma2 family endonuclease
MTDRQRQDLGGDMAPKEHEQDEDEYDEEAVVPLTYAQVMALAGQRMTADEFLALPPIEQHVQLIDGELVVTEPTFRHQRIVIWMMTELYLWTEQGPDRGEVITMAARLSDRDVFVPDVLWLRPVDRPPRDASYLNVPPALAVEVRSRSTWHLDQGRKRRVYEATGVAELWLVDPYTEIVQVFRRSSPDAPVFDEQLVLGTNDILTTPLLPGLVLDLATLFTLDPDQ